MNTQIKDALQNVKVALEQLGDELKKNADERKDCVVEQVKNSLLNLSEKIKGETAAANAKALSEITEFSDKFKTGAKDFSLETLDKLKATIESLSEKIK